MSVTTPSEQDLETSQFSPVPMGNYEQIGEYQEQVDSFVTMLKEKIEPDITVLEIPNLISATQSFLRERLGSVEFEAHAFHKIHEVDREPRYVIDILVAIPEYDRNRKFTILSIIGDLMREYPNLLFDFRITGESDIPEGYSAIR